MDPSLDFLACLILHTYTLVWYQTLTPLFLTSISHTLHTQPIWHGSVCSVQCVEHWTRCFMGSTLTTDFIFLSSAYNVSTGPTCQKVDVCFSVFPVFFQNFYLRCFKSEFDALKSKFGSTHRVYWEDNLKWRWEREREREREREFIEVI